MKTLEAGLQDHTVKVIPCRYMSSIIGLLYVYMSIHIWVRLNNCELMCITLCTLSRNVERMVVSRVSGDASVTPAFTSVARSLAHAWLTTLRQTLRMAGASSGGKTTPRMCNTSGRSTRFRSPSQCNYKYSVAPNIDVAKSDIDAAASACGENRKHPKGLFLAGGNCPPEAAHLTCT